MSIEPAARGMQWTQRNGTVALDVSPADVATALPRMWSRLVRATGHIAAGDWEKPSRCSEWRAVDVVNHIADLNRMGFEVAQAALEGRRSTILDGFDPRTVPKRLTDAADRDPAVAQTRLVSSVESLLAGLDRLDLANPDPVVQSPVGRQPMAASLLHVLWDTWLHERDLFLPLGHSVPELDDEVRLCAVYTLRMLGFTHQLFGREAHVALVLSGGCEGTLRLDVDAGSLRVAAGAVELDGQSPPRALRGDAATAVDALCGRGDLHSALDGPDELRAELGSLSGLLGGS